MHKIQVWCIGTRALTIQASRQLAAGCSVIMGALRRVLVVGVVSGPGLLSLTIRSHLMKGTAPQLMSPAIRPLPMLDFYFTVLSYMLLFCRLGAVGLLTCQQFEFGWLNLACLFVCFLSGHDGGSKQGRKQHHDNIPTVHDPDDDDDEDIESMPIAPSGPPPQYSTAMNHMNIPPGERTKPNVSRSLQGAHLQCNEHLCCHTVLFSGLNSAV